MTAKAFEVNCEKGPTVEEALALCISEGYWFAQLEMPTNTYGWLIGVRFDTPPPLPVHPDSSGMLG